MFLLYWASDTKTDARYNSWKTGSYHNIRRPLTCQEITHINDITRPRRCYLVVQRAVNNGGIKCLQAVLWDCWTCETKWRWLHYSDNGAHGTPTYVWQQSVAEGENVNCQRGGERLSSQSNPIYCQVTHHAPVFLEQLQVRRFARKKFGETSVTHEGPESISSLVSCETRASSPHTTYIFASSVFEHFFSIFSFQVNTNFLSLSARTKC